jgi:hypothetical protein
MQDESRFDNPLYVRVLEIAGLVCDLADELRGEDHGFDEFLAEHPELASLSTVNVDSIAEAEIDTSYMRGLYLVKWTTIGWLDGLPLRTARLVDWLDDRLLAAK